MGQISIWQHIFIIENQAKCIHSFAHDTRTEHFSKLLRQEKVHGSETLRWFTLGICRSWYIFTEQDWKSVFFKILALLDPKNHSVLWSLSCFKGRGFDLITKFMLIWIEKRQKCWPGQTQKKLRPNSTYYSISCDSLVYWPCAVSARFCKWVIRPIYFNKRFKKIPNRSSIVISGHHNVTSWLAHAFTNGNSSNCSDRVNGVRLLMIRNIIETMTHVSPITSHLLHSMSMACGRLYPRKLKHWLRSSQRS